jgi:TATA-box binding protein (TBP) (component of TFIID and TFIIIB)
MVTHSLQLECTLNVQYLIHSLNNFNIIEYTNDSLAIQLADSSCMVKVYANGLVMASGIEEMSVYFGLLDVVQRIQDLGYEIKFEKIKIFNITQPKIQNIVATVDLGCCLNLQQIANCQCNVIYDPKSTP